MSKYHLPPRLTAVALFLAVGGTAEAKTPKSDGFPCAQQTLKRVEIRSGNFEIVTRPLLEAPMVQSVALRIGQAVHVDRALLSQIAAPGSENGR